MKALIISMVLAAAPGGAAEPRQARGDSAGESRFSVPPGWKQAEVGGAKSRRQAFTITKGKAQFKVRPLGETLSDDDCLSMTDEMGVESGREHTAPSPIKNDSGLSGYVSRAAEGGGSAIYFGHFTWAKKSYSFLLTRATPAIYREAMTALGVAGPKKAEEKTKAAGRPRLAPVTYSTDKMSRPGPK